MTSLIFKEYGTEFYTMKTSSPLPGHWKTCQVKHALCFRSIWAQAPASTSSSRLWSRSRLGAPKPRAFIRIYGDTCWCLSQRRWSWWTCDRASPSLTLLSLSLLTFAFDWPFLYLSMASYLLAPSLSEANLSSIYLFGAAPTCLPMYT